MKTNRYKQVIALLLLVVFSVNTLLGFACSLGINMGYNKHHHRQEVAAVVNHCHTNKQQQSHNHAGNVPVSKDDCCSHGVTSFNLVDKIPADGYKIVQPAPAVTIATVFCNMRFLLNNDEAKDTTYSIQDHHPPIPDIRVAIQSFQV